METIVISRLKMFFFFRWTKYPGITNLSYELVQIQAIHNRNKQTRNNNNSRQIILLVFADFLLTEEDDELLMLIRSVKMRQLVDLPQVQPIFQKVHVGWLRYVCAELNHRYQERIQISTESS